MKVPEQTAWKSLDHMTVPGPHSGLCPSPVSVPGSGPGSVPRQWVLCAAVMYCPEQV